MAVQIHRYQYAVWKDCIVAMVGRAMRVYNEQEWSETIEQRPEARGEGTESKQQLIHEAWIVGDWVPAQARRANQVPFSFFRSGASRGARRGENTAAQNPYGLTRKARGSSSSPTVRLDRSSRDGDGAEGVPYSPRKGLRGLQQGPARRGDYRQDREDPPGRAGEDQRKSRAETSLEGSKADGGLAPVAAGGDRRQPLHARAGRRSAAHGRVPQCSRSWRPAEPFSRNRSTGCSWRDVSSEPGCCSSCSTRSTPRN